MSGPSPAPAAVVAAPALAAVLARTEARLRAALAAATGERAATTEAASAAADRAPPEGAPPHPGLALVADRFGLEPLEGALLEVLLAVEVSPGCAALCERLAPGGRGHPTVAALAAALAVAPADVIAALVPAAHLARSGLVEVIGDGAFPQRTARLPDSLWPRLVGLPARLPFPIVARGGALDGLALAPSTRAQAARVIERAAGPDADRALVVVVGPPARQPDAVAAALAAAFELAAVFVPAAAVDDPAWLPAIRREALWSQAAVIVQGAPAPAALARLAGELVVPIFLVSERGLDGADDLAPGRWRADVEVAPLGPDQRPAMWQRAAARTTAPRLSGLARRLDGNRSFAELVLPASTRRELALVASWARHAAALRGPATGPGLRNRTGLVCLFYGAPGTGKTLAAQAIASELGLLILRVDLSQVVNKYIGETEKNLDRVFDEAEAAGAILFFDEADALFGKRSEVKDAHDRYANIETAFLLQRLESHDGICVLASNLRQNLDEAFTRRIQIIAEFPLPGPEERTLIWDRHLVRAHLAADVDLPALGARFALSGGDICNAAGTAVLLAAAEAQPIGMRHLAIGVWREIKKSGRLMSADDFGPWRELIADHAR